MSKGYFPRSRAKQRDSAHWISMSDLMAGLMMVFLFISIAYMHYVRVERDKIKQVAVAYQNTQAALYTALNHEFSSDLDQWDAEIDEKTLEFRFKSPEVLFEVGSVGLKPQFQNILTDFFPRYLKVLENFRSNITDIRIEGHTSSDWSGATTSDLAYFRNMALSQGRTTAVLQYLYNMPAVSNQRPWIKDVFSAVGYSSAHPILDEKGKEDPERSRRVTFKAVTNAEIQIQKILQE